MELHPVIVHNAHTATNHSDILSAVGADTDLLCEIIDGNGNIPYGQLTGDDWFDLFPSSSRQSTTDARHVHGLGRPPSTGFDDSSIADYFATIKSAQASWVVPSIAGTSFPSFLSMGTATPGLSVFWRSFEEI